MTWEGPTLSGGYNPLLVPIQCVGTVWLVSYLQWRIANRTKQQITTPFTVMY